MRLRLALAVAASALTPLVVAAPAEAAPCVTTTRTITGTLLGQDGRYVGAMLGFSLLDSRGRTIDGRAGSSAFGCPGFYGYGGIVRMNPHTLATGSTTVGTKSWSLKVPTNVTLVWIEVYPRDYGTAVKVDHSRYGNGLRYKVPIPYGKAINIRLPLVCAKGGKTGYIGGFSYKNGVRKPLGYVAAWSQAPDNNSASPVLGFSVGFALSSGYFKIPDLAGGQYYTIQYTMDGVMKQVYKVWVNPCKATSTRIAF